MRTFYRTVVSYEILSEEPLPPLSLEQIGQYTDDGPGVGRFLDTVETELTRKQMADALLNAGSEPGFFRLDDDGADWDDWDDNEPSTQEVEP